MREYTHTYLHLHFFILLYSNRSVYKNKFSSIHNPRLNKIIGCGVVTDGTFKLEVHVINFNIDAYLDLDLRKDDKIQIIEIKNRIQVSLPSEISSYID